MKQIKKLIDDERLKSIMEDILETFRNYDLRQAEMEFVIAELNKISENFNLQKNISEIVTK